MNVGIIFLIVFMFMFMGGMIYYLDWSERQKKDKKIESECISRDYYNIPGLNRCMRCGNEAFLTTSVVMPAVEIKKGKLKYNKYDTKILYSLHCRNCSLCTAQCEDVAVVLREWNETDLTRIKDRTKV